MILAYHAVNFHISELFITSLYSMFISNIYNTWVAHYLSPHLLFIRKTKVFFFLRYFVLLFFHLNFKIGFFLCHRSIKVFCYHIKFIDSVFRLFIVFWYHNILFTWLLIDLSLFLGIFLFYYRWNPC